MARAFSHKEINIEIGDTVSFSYRIKEGAKERVQKFAGIVIKVKGNDIASKTFTTRRMTRSGIGVERIIPLSSPFLTDITITKKGKTTRSKLYYIRNRSEQEIRRKVYH